MRLEAEHNQTETRRLFFICLEMKNATRIMQPKSQLQRHTVPAGLRTVGSESIAKSRQCSAFNMVARSNLRWRSYWKFLSASLLHQPLSTAIWQAQAQTCRQARRDIPQNRGDELSILVQDGRTGSNCFVVKRACRPTLLQLCSCGPRSLTFFFSRAWQHARRNNFAASRRMRGPVIRSLP